MALSSEPRSIKISGNIIENTTLSFGGGHTYNGCLKTSGTGSILDNNFAGCASASTGATKIVEFIGTSASYTVQNNTFARGSTSVLAYIYDSCTSKKDHLITDNVFDSPTVNGTSETLVSNITSSSNYFRNKNQTQYKSIGFGNNFSSLTQGFNFTDGYFYFRRTNELPANGVAFSPFHLTIVHSSADPSPAEKTFGSTEGLNKFLPENVSLIEAKVSMRSFNPGSLTTSTPNSSFTFSVAKYNDAPTSSTKSTNLNSISYGTFTGSEVNYLIDKVTTTVSAATINATTSSIDLTLDLTTFSSGNTTANQQEFALVMDVNFKRSPSTGINIIVSPFIVKYRW